MPGLAHRHLEHGHDRRRHAQRAGRPGLDVAAQPAAARLRAQDRHRAGVRDGGGDAAQADPLLDAEPRASSTSAAQNACQRSSGSGPARTSRSRSPTRARLMASSGQVSSCQPAVDDLEGRAAAPGSRTAGRCRSATTTGAPSTSCAERRRGRAAGIDPAVERRDDASGATRSPGSPGLPGAAIGTGSRREGYAAGAQQPGSATAPVDDGPGAGEDASRDVGRLDDLGLRTRARARTRRRPRSSRPGMRAVDPAVGVGRVLVDRAGRTASPAGSGRSTRGEQRIVAVDTPAARAWKRLARAAQNAAQVEVRRSRAAGSSRIVTCAEARRAIRPRLAVDRRDEIPDRALGDEADRVDRPRHDRLRRTPARRRW